MIVRSRDIVKDLHELDRYLRWYCETERTGYAII